jgi:hypothetical protein
MVTKAVYVKQGDLFAARMATSANMHQKPCEQESERPY